jgi:hypothetical protein
MALRYYQRYKRPPSILDDDPLYGFHKLSLLFASGTLPVTQSVYTMLASSKLVALTKPSSNKPRPIGITGVFHRFGMTALLKACTPALATHFGTQREYGTGISGATNSTVRLNVHPSQRNGTTWC